MSWQAKNDSRYIDNLQKQIETLSQRGIIISKVVNSGARSTSGYKSHVNSTGLNAGIIAWNPAITMIHDLDITGSPRTATGVFDKIDLTSTSMVVDYTSSPMNLKYILYTPSNGTLIAMKPKQGKQLILKTGGNINISADITIEDDQVAILQFHTDSTSPDNDGNYIVVSVSGESTVFPILYPMEDLGNKGFESVNFSVNQTDGHYKKVTLTGDISIQITNDPPTNKGFKFYIYIVQDGTGGHSLTSVDTAVKNGSLIDKELDKAPNGKTLVQFSTVNGGVDWFAEVIGSITEASEWARYVASTDVDMNDLNISDVGRIAFSTLGGAGDPTRPVIYLDVLNSNFNIQGRSIHDIQLLIGDNISNDVICSFNKSIIDFTHQTVPFTEVRLGDVHVYGINQIDGSARFLDGLWIKESTPPTNDALFAKLYAKASGGTSKLFYIDSAGTEFGPLGGASNWSQFPATQNVDFDGFTLLDVGLIQGSTVTNQINDTTTGWDYFVDLGHTHDFYINGIREFLMSTTAFDCKDNNIINVDLITGLTGTGILGLGTTGNAVNVWGNLVAKGDSTFGQTSGDLFTVIATATFQNDVTIGLTTADDVIFNAYVNSDFRPKIHNTQLCGEASHAWFAVRSVQYDMDGVSSALGTTTYRIVPTNAGTGSGTATEMSFEVPATKGFGYYQAGVLLARMTSTEFDMNALSITNALSIEVNTISTTAGFRDVGFTADPTTPLAGEMYYNTTSNEFRFYNGSIWVAMGGGTSDKIEEGDSKVEVIDSTTGSIAFYIDNLVTEKANMTASTFNLTSLDLQMFNNEINSAGNITFQDNGVAILSTEIGLYHDAVNLIMNVGLTSDGIILSVVGNQKFGVGNSGNNSFNPLNMNSNKITNLTDPTADQDGATKKYVDDTATGGFGAYVAGTYQTVQSTGNNNYEFWYCANLADDGVNTGVAMVEDKIWYAPLYVAKATNVKYLAVYLTVGSTPDGNPKNDMAIYTNRANENYPNTKLVESVGNSLLNTGYSICNIADTALPVGLYWIAHKININNANVRIAHAPARYLLPIGWEQNDNVVTNGKTVGYTDTEVGGFPTTAPDDLLKHKASDGFFPLLFAKFVT